MIERPVPQDILKYKTKFAAGLSLREFGWGVGGVVVALICFFYIFAGISNMQTKAVISACFTLPFFLVGFVKIMDMPFEKAITQIFIENFIYPPIRKYEIHYPEMEKYKKKELEYMKSKESKDIPKTKAELKHKAGTKAVPSPDYPGIL